MDFDEAVNAHVLWKMKLINYLGNPDGSLKSQETQLESECPLSQWLDGEGAKWRSFPEYSNLVSEHAKFHLEAVIIVDKAQSGKEVLGETALGTQSGFAVASANLISAIMKMKARGISKDKHSDMISPGQ
ncbi:MAG: CZB domain-containing protein [Nitrospirae bacterium]|nr:CZB domain-containing protein [Nitrospirota bacterium]MBI3593917.1 CZB domain-containing protein [Nitrospirota bacterium]